MSKFALTTEGIAQLQERLYQMDDENLKQAAVAITDDALAWIANHFEIKVSLFEAMRDVSENVWLMFGWRPACLAAIRSPSKNATRGIARMYFILGLPSA